MDIEMQEKKHFIHIIDGFITAFCTISDDHKNAYRQKLQKLQHQKSVQDKQNDNENTEHMDE